MTLSLVTTSTDVTTTVTQILAFVGWTNAER